MFFIKNRKFTRWRPSIFHNLTRDCKKKKTKLFPRICSFQVSLKVFGPAQIFTFNCAKVYNLFRPRVLSRVLLSNARDFFSQSNDEFARSDRGDSLSLSLSISARAFSRRKLSRREASRIPTRSDDRNADHNERLHHDGDRSHFGTRRTSSSSFGPSRSSLTHLQRDEKETTNAARWTRLP